MNRRKFLQTLTETGLVAVTAPLFVPAERLTFGVPSSRSLADYRKALVEAMDRDMASLRTAHGILSDDLSVFVRSWSRTAFLGRETDQIDIVQGTYVPLIDAPELQPYRHELNYAQEFDIYRMTVQEAVWWKDQDPLHNL